MAAMLIGYARCSTDSQDLTAQRDGLTALGVEGNRIYVDHGLLPDATETDPVFGKRWQRAAPATLSLSPNSTGWPAPFPTPATSWKNSPPPA